MLYDYYVLSFVIDTHPCLMGDPVAHLIEARRMSDRCKSLLHVIDIYGARLDVRDVSRQMKFI